MINKVKIQEKYRKVEVPSTVKSFIFVGLKFRGLKIRNEFIDI